MLHTLILYSAVCQLYLKKLEIKKNVVAKSTISKVKNQLTTWEKVFEIYVTDKSLISLLYKVLLYKELLKIEEQKMINIW